MEIKKGVPHPGYGTLGVMIGNNWRRCYYHQIIFNEYFPNNGHKWRTYDRANYDRVINNISILIGELLKCEYNKIVLDFKNTQVFNKYYNTSDTPFDLATLYNDINIYCFVEKYGYKYVLERLTTDGLTLHEWGIFRRYIKNKWADNINWGDAIMLGGSIEPLY